MKKALWAVLLLCCGLAQGQKSGPFNLNTQGTSGSASCAVISLNPATSSTVVINVSGTFSLTLQPAVQVQGQAVANVLVTPSTSTTAQSTITAAGAYYANVGPVNNFQVCVSAYTSGTAVVYLNAGSGVNASILGGSGGGGSGTVTSVAQTVPSWMSVSGSPITTAGTLALTGATGQTSHQVVGTCGSSTTVGQCSLVAGDLPIIPITQVGSAGLSGSGGVSIASTGAISLSAIPIASVGSAGLSGSGGISVASTGVISLSGNLNVGAGTGTSLIVTGILDGTVPVTITTGTSATLGAGTYSSGYTLNQEATAGTGVTYTLPATAVGLQYCVSNSGTTGVVNTGVLTVYPPSSSYVILNGTVNTVGGGGTHGVASGGAAADAACFIAIDSTHWQVFPVKGTWTAN